MKIKVFCLIIFYMSVTCVSSVAQAYLTVKDYQLLKMDIASTKPFESFSKISTSCSNDYLLKELTKASMTAGLLWGCHALGIHTSHYGYSKYGELTSSLAYSVKLGAKIALGIRFHYIFQHVDHYESQHSVTFDFSMYAQVSRKLSFAIELYNPARLKYGLTGNTVIPMRFTVATLYEYGEKLLFSVKIIKELPGMFDVSAMCCYHPRDVVYLSAVLSLHYVECGVMIRCRQLYFSAQIKCNYNLGFVPEAGILYQLPRKLKVGN